LVSLGGLGVLHETQKEFAAHLKYNEQDLSSLKISVLNLSKSLEAIDAVADNVTDLRTKVEKGKGSSKPISVSVRVSPTKVNLVQSETIIFHANVAGTSDLGVRWTTSPSHGTIKPNGEYKAPASISKEEYVTVKATSVADASKSSTAIVNLKPKLGRKANEPVSEVAVQVTPDHASLAAGEKQIFTATVMGASETSVTWSLEGDGGIQQDGKYSAPDDVPEPTAARVKATSKKDPTKFGTATVDLSPTIPGAIPR
jgi:hypothetical protein